VQTTRLIQCLTPRIQQPYLTYTNVFYVYLQRVNFTGWPGTGCSCRNLVVEVRYKDNDMAVRDEGLPVCARSALSHPA